MTVMKKIVLASNNKGKVREINQILTELNISVLPQSDFNVDEAEETGLTFVENAILKARNAAAQSGLSAIADDSGIEVDALNGEPGIYSARYAGVGASDKDNLQKLLQALQDVPEEKRTARFQCLMVYLHHAKDPTPFICQGTWEGIITREPQGENGFGYDPVFYVPDHNCTSAQLPAAVKNQLSHRGQALRLLVKQLGQNQKNPL
ncbi:Nucleoside 5-triphosphatase RdgB (dHAPTP, dITP, XTP-specific) [hydrothermal vent metagenome]|uniref:dITP/XTP pyrophosphatase n=1 Tax=hydrothermal vent metagenome TaxID=652676 RepID=A0A3B1BNM2_9ZZZZ